jgi:hypothetical protein
MRLEAKDVIAISHPRVRLEDYFLRVVEKAQAANLQTSGARKGGEIPDFLQKPTESARGVVGDLVFASQKIKRIEPAPLAPTPDLVQRNLINDLVKRPVPLEPEDVPPPCGAPAPARKPVGPQIRPAADRAVIDALLINPDESGVPKGDGKR